MIVQALPYTLSLLLHSLDYIVALWQPVWGYVQLLS